ncbi:MAG: thiamine phosphate synthase [Pirellulaceae bacterium]
MQSKTEAFPLLAPADRLAAWRILDANLNRATEGLRVVEEYCRFRLADRHLSERCKQLRHDLVTALAGLPGKDMQAMLHAARETQQDVGTQIETVQEGRRESLGQLLAANWQRVEQALRVLEEYSKLLAPAVGATIEALRYRAYTLAKAGTISADSQHRLEHARLYVLLDGGSSEQEFAERARALVAAGVHVIQLRAKTLADRELLARARVLRSVIDETPPAPSPEPRTPNPRPLLIINDRPDLAVLARADGVHLGQTELTVLDARQIVGPELLIGISTHTIGQARQAVFDGANYLGCGPTFPSGTKQFDQFPGLAFLRQVADEISLPAFAIGGITASNLPDVLATGIRRVAIAGALATTSDIPAEVAALHAGL